MSIIIIITSINTGIIALLYMHFLIMRVVILVGDNIVMLLS